MFPAALLAGPNCFLAELEMGDRISEVMSEVLMAPTADLDDETDC